MRKTIYTCDHCGKELNEMNDCIEIIVDNFIDVVYTDLCSDCERELNEIILKYINKKQCK
jgi:DNA-directed RNA polymerase subunit RPC12/RpoP